MNTASLLRRSKSHRAATKRNAEAIESRYVWWTVVSFPIHSAKAGMMNLKAHGYKIEQANENRYGACIELLVSPYRVQPGVICDGGHVVREERVLK